MSLLQAYMGSELLAGHSTVPTASIMKSAKYIGLYFSAHWCGPCRNFTPLLAQSYGHLHSQGLQIVFVSSDHNEASFREYYSQMPWKAVPFSSDREAIKSQYGVMGIPMLVVVSADGTVITPSGTDLLRNDPSGQLLLQTLRASLPMPSTRAHYQHQALALASGIQYGYVQDEPASGVLAIVGPELLHGYRRLSTASVVGAAKWVALYFSASWCGPCHRFTPKLAAANSYLESQGMQVVFVSLDQTEGAFLEYYAQMPWKAVPYSRDRQALQDHFGVQGIPKLVVVTADGAVVSTQGVELVSNDPTGQSFIRTLPQPAPMVVKVPRSTSNLQLVYPAAGVAPAAPAPAATAAPPPAKWVGLYFGAQWCKSCQSFNPLLGKRYAYLRSKGLRILFVSLDHDESSFKEYSGKMPWQPIGWAEGERERLTKQCEVEAVPRLVVLNMDGTVATKDGVDLFFNDQTGKRLLSAIEAQA